MEKAWIHHCSVNVSVLHQYVEKLELGGFISISDYSSPDRNLNTAGLLIHTKDDDVRLMVSLNLSRKTGHWTNWGKSCGLLHLWAGRPLQQKTKKIYIHFLPTLKTYISPEYRCLKKNDPHWSLFVYFVLFSFRHLVWRHESCGKASSSQ